ncbi:hypothetical protein [Pseudomonas aeruginosa]|uniref:hypothetical protein n=1 Tax=Pseudomonas aeruginosa TaxID=287 RepID=UPI001C8D2D87|nr:hypothetical protein [Pseudomonas aeruginosa]
MNKANECTCPSGDGSLVHPCPAHPAVEQAGGDERAAFELFVRKHCGMPEHIAVNWDAKFTNDAWEGWQARAALAQPSPKCATCGGTGMVDDGEITCSEGGIPYENGPVKCVKDCPDCKAQHSPAQAEQAEAGRPEMSPERATYFMRRFKCEEKLLGPNEQAAVDYVLSLLAQHDRIVGPLRYKAELYDEVWALVTGKGYMNVTTAISVLESERDAALARVAELEQKSAGSWTVDTSCGRPILMYEGCSVIEDQTAYEVVRMIKWIGELERQEPVATVAKVPGEDWNSLDFHRDLQHMQPGTKLYAAPVAQAQQLHDLDKQCRDDVARALGLRPNQERGFAWSYLLASIKSCVKASGDSAQAQHSVPDGAADLCRFLAKLYCELDGLRYSTAKLPAEQIADALIFKWPVLQGARNQLNIKRISEQPYDESKLHSAIAAMLAAAPGNSVPQAWLDVQAERRRQVEAEGWTPEHDDEHDSGELAAAGAAYALHAADHLNPYSQGDGGDEAPSCWPWHDGIAGRGEGPEKSEPAWWKPTTPRRDLVKACALALAEIERLDRAGISQSPQPGATTASS